MSAHGHSFTVISTMAALLFTFFYLSAGVRYTVGGSVWSIPEYPDFYSNWSASHFFQIGDSLLFEFETEFHNVMQVSRLEYARCTAENPFKVFNAGPVVIFLAEKGVYNFMCNVSNYCSLGQKISVAVHQAIAPSPSPLPSPSRSPPHMAPVLPTQPRPSLAPVSPSPSLFLPSDPPVREESPSPELPFVNPSMASPGKLLFGWGFGICTVVGMIIL